MQYFSTSTTVLKSLILTATAVTVVGCALILPLSASAYSTTEQSVTQLTNDTFLFQVTYRYSFLNREVRVPILASRTSVIDTTSPQVQYSLRDTAGELITTGASTAIVLSDTTIEDKQYYLPERTPGLFTLFAIVQLPADTVAAGGAASLQIDWLPFTLINEGETRAARVPSADLTDYRTPMITW